MTEKLLYTDNLSVGYSGRVVVGNVNIGLLPGRIVALIGPNGAGKSTILKTIARQLPPVSGRIFLEEKNLFSLPEVKLAKTMSILMTERPRPEMMTCFDIASAGRYPYTGWLGVLSEQDKAQVWRAMELTGVSDLAGRDFNLISDGQRQLVMLARAICQQPRILVLDEPTSFLDIRHKLSLLSIIKKLVNEQKIAVIMSLHELDLAQRIADTVVCVRNGAIDKSGTPGEIFSGGYIGRLFGVEQGSYNELFGVPELQPPAGEPGVFVISGGGRGIELFRRLQKQGLPFAVGILHENDVELPAAHALAADVITETAFEPIKKSTLERAMSVMEKCPKVICCLQSFGTLNDGNRLLFEMAKNQGKLTED